MASKRPGRPTSTGRSHSRSSSAVPGTVLVYSWSGETYVVDVLEERCECPDHIETLAGEGWCKHLVAAGVVTGQIELPIPPHLRMRADVSDREASRTDVLS